MKRYDSIKFKTMEELIDYFNDNQEFTIVSIMYIEYHYQVLFYE